MNIQRKNSAHHFRMQSEREQTLGKTTVQTQGRTTVELALGKTTVAKWATLIEPY